MIVFDYCDWEDIEENLKDYYRYSMVEYEKNHHLTKHRFESSRQKEILLDCLLYDMVNYYTNNTQLPFAFEVHIVVVVEFEIVVDLLGQLF